MRITWPGAVALALALAGGRMAAAQPAPTDAQVEQRVSALLAQMTLDEKVGQLVQLAGIPFIPGPRPEEALPRGAGGSVLWLNDPKKFNAVQKIAVEQSRLKIPLIFGLDVIHGYRTIFPIPLGMAASWDPALYEKAQALAAREARAAGVHWTFAPMVDVARDARWGRIAEGAGEDPFLGAAMAAAQVRGFQGERVGAPEHVLACAKHFAGYGAAEGGRDYDGAYVPEGLLRNVYLPPFRAAEKAGVGSFMSAYMDLNDVPAAANTFLLTDVLRKEWGFRGFVVSDAFAVASLVTQGHARDGRDAAARALAAGLDMDMASDTFAPNLAALVKDGTLSEAQIDAAVRRVLEAKVRLGLFENPYVDESAVDAVLNAPAHRALSRVAAQRSMVLLRNEKGLLPLRKDPGTVAVIGPLADSKTATEGSWMVFGHTPAAVTVLDGIRERLGAGRVLHAKGPDIRRTIPSFIDELTPGPKPEPQPAAAAEAAFHKAVETAQAADVVVMVLGEEANMSGEASSRSTLGLPGRQQDLLEAVVALGKPVVLVLLNGRPLALEWAAEHVPAILEAWQPGTEGGRAVADVLFGDVNPGGKLPVTFPRAGQTPLYYAHTLSHAPEGSKFYRSRYWEAPSTPVFPFGFGLSYATFTYATPVPAADAVAVGQPLVVTAEVRNTGAVAGDEVAQLYIHQRHGSDSRPVRLLKGFERVTLAPGEKKTVRFTLSPEELGYWSTARGAWVQEAAPFDVWVGGDSTAAQHAAFSVTPAGAAPPAPRPAVRISAPVKTESGPVTGVVADGVVAFKGVPYAAPPVGDRRWRAPQPPAPWSGVRAADRYAHDCMQEPFPSDAAPLGTPPDEDCLYLNVWAPAARAARPLPVMVWFHGGGFVNGGSSPAVYDGSAFARKGVVFVSFNHRLGRFGFFAHPALTRETPQGPLGNYGFLDQIAVLRWVKRNVAAFGGDPGNVTIFGESAGGGSVNTMMIAPLAKGLFHKAIVESGGGRARGPISMRRLRAAAPGGPPSGEDAGRAFAAGNGITGDDAAALAALRALPAAKLVNGMNLMNQQPDTYAGPMVDGQIVPDEVEPLFRAGKQARVPYLIGANALEFGFFALPAERTKESFAAFGPDTAAATAAYAGNGDPGVALMSDQAMVEPARLLARLAAAAGQPTWQYRFSYVATSIRDTARGALHATEIPFVFDTVRAKYEAATSAQDEAMGAAMNAYWVAFARTGDPNGGGRPRWPAYTAATDTIMDFGPTGPVAGPDPWKGRLDLVETLASRPR